MKKLTAILLIALFTFNLFGYRLLFYSLMQHSEIVIERTFDNNQYNESDLITIKVPLSVGYQVSETEFERCDGEIDVNGVIYKYVKRKVSNGELVLMCLPYKAKMHLEKAKNEVFKSTNDLQTSASGKGGNNKNFTGKYITSDYNQVINDYTISSALVINKVNNIPSNSTLASPFNSSDDRPPEVL